MLNKLGVLTNTSCNLSCRYCYVKRSPKKITYSIFRKSLATFIQFYKNNPQDSRYPSLVFVGGEPLLCWDILKKSILFAYKAINHLNVSVVTNGTLLDYSKFSFLNKLGVRIILSLDGPADIHNYYRKSDEYSTGTLEVIVKKIKKIQFKARSSILIYSVISPPFLSNLFDRLDYFRKLGFKSFRFFPNFNWREWQLKDINKFESAMNKFAVEYCNIFSMTYFKHRIFIIDNLNEIIKAREVNKDNIKYIENKFDDCGSLWVDTEGKFIVCGRVLGVSNEKSRNLSITKRNGRIDITKRSLLLEEAREYFIKAAKRNKVSDCSFIFCPFSFYFNEKLLKSSELEFNKAILFYFRITKIYNNTMKSILSNLIENKLFRQEYGIR